MPSVALRKRLDALEAVVEERLEELMEERVEEEIANLLTLLEQHLSREEFLRVAHIAAWGPSARLKRRGRGKLWHSVAV
jgi:hypothetical protein